MRLSDELIRFVNEHEKEDVHTLALQSHKYPQIDISLAICQITGRRIAKDKIPAWYENQQIVYPKHLPLEQSSSQATAQYKASLCSGKSMVDLTGGLGVDFYFISQNFNNATYVEQQYALAELATYNFKVLGLNVQTVNADAIDYLHSMSYVDLIYIDPARRDNIGKKTVRIEDCTPNILEIEDLLEQKAERVMIKLSPMLDISLALKSLKNISQVHIISVDNECKELLFIKEKEVINTIFHCINIYNGATDIYTFTKEKEADSNISCPSVPGKYLYEPNASILKAGAYKIIADEYSVSKLHPSSHLYTSDRLIYFPGRKFTIDGIYTLNKKDIKEYIAPLKQANITTRNFPLSVNEIRKKTGLKEGGDIYIFATTLANDKRVLIICRKA
ncbi:MAG: class I SAM-dependent methyltransferase [Prevotella sp.]|jgi:hypothetical protein|nr:class I SAM-dependent methyltransferase [Prevotella sp.]